MYMKRIIFLVLFGMVAVSMYPQLSFGVKTGLTVSSFSNIETKIKANTGYKAGVSIEYMFSRWGVNSGVYLSKTGVAYSEGLLQSKDNIAGFAVMEISPQYITIPLSAVYKIPIDNQIKLSFNAGLYFGYGISGKGFIRYDNGGYGISAFEDNRIANDPRFLDFTIPKANRTDLGVILGIGIDIQNFNIGISYEQGGLNVYDQYPVSPSSSDIKNSVFWVGVGYNFTIR